MFELILIWILAALGGAVIGILGGMGISCLARVMGKAVFVEDDASRISA